jgi:hypothetical protein
MKILDIISEDNALNEGGITQWFKRPFEDFLEKRAAAMLIKQIEKKYANDLAKQTACKDLSEKYGKYLAERELAGQTPIPLERLILKQPEYRGTSFATDQEFIDLTTRLAQFKKTQYLKDGAQAGKEAGKAKDEPNASPATGSVKATEDIIKANEELRKRVSERIKWITTTYRWFLAASLGKILWDWDEEHSTIEAQAKTGEIPESDAPYFPPVVTKGVAVSSNAKYATQWHWANAFKTDIPYTYDNVYARVQSWKDWRLGMADQTAWGRVSAWAGSIFASAKVVEKLGKTGWITDFAKWLDAMDKNTGIIKKTIGMGILGGVSLLNRTGQLIFVNKMSSDDMHDVFKAILVGNLTETLPEAARKTIEAGLAGTIPHQVAFVVVAKAFKAILDSSGNTVPPRTKEAEPKNTSDVDAANPMQQDPSQRNTPVDQTDSNGTVSKPAEKKAGPENKEAPKAAPEDNTPAGRGQRFSNAKENGEATVTINGKTYTTADFKEDGKYWTNDKTGESFLRY